MARQPTVKVPVREVSYEAMLEAHGGDSLDVPGFIDDGPDPDHFALQDRLIGAVAQLPQSERAVVPLYGMDRLTHAEVGEELGISAKAAQKRWSRARKTLRPLLSDFSPQARLIVIFATLSTLLTVTAPSSTVSRDDADGKTTFSIGDPYIAKSPRVASTVSQCRLSSARELPSDYMFDLSYLPHGYPAILLSHSDRATYLMTAVIPDLSRDEADALTDRIYGAKGHIVTVRHTDIEGKSFEVSMWLTTLLQVYREPEPSSSRFQLIIVFDTKYCNWTLNGWLYMIARHGGTLSINPVP